MEDFFYKLGRRTGRNLRKGYWLWSSVAGSEEQALAAEYDAGCDLARSYDRQTCFDDSRRSTALLEEVGERLSAKLKKKQRRWRILPILDDSPGAFALPGGFLYVTRSLLELCGHDEDEIACVIGHEMGHVVRGHAIERVANQVLSDSALRIARIPSGLLSQWILSAGANLLSSAYTRDQELEADEFGARLAAAAGYDPRGAIRALSRLQSSETKRGVPLAAYFASHPPLSIRIEQLRRLIRVRGE
jgi:predicted Zn-dependent protease